MCQHPKDPVWNTGVPQRVHCTVLLSMILLWEHSNQITVVLFHLVQLKFIYSEKATKFCEISTSLLCAVVKIRPNLKNVSCCKMRIIHVALLIYYFQQKKKSKSFTNFWNFENQILMMFDPTYSSLCTLKKKKCFIWYFLGKNIHSVGWITLLQKWGHTNYAAVGN